MIASVESHQRRIIVGAPNEIPVVTLDEAIAMLRPSSMDEARIRARLDYSAVTVVRVSEGKR